MKINSMALKIALATVIVSSQFGWAQPATTSITVDSNAPSKPFPHFWEQMFGSGRAILTLRESYRNDLRDVKKVTDFRYVRFHNILHDEVGVYDEDENGNPVYNFTYVDQIYDGLLQNGVRPVVEISFMPKKLALRQDVHPFWYKQIVSPPKDYAKWDDLMRAFAKHLVERYGLDEVSQWYFEVWNEPNIDFWTGDPKEDTYFELYDHTAKALKEVSPRLRVGGPATSSAHWVDDFIAHVATNNVPVDFISSHSYADDTTEDIFGHHMEMPMNQRVCGAIRKVHEQIAQSKRPTLPLFWTEWSVPSYGDLNARDNVYVGPALAYDIEQCDGLVDMMSWWTFSDVFEENGPRREPFDGGFGIMAAGGIKKPSYSAFRLLHMLGTERLANPADALVTRRKDGTIVLALWNLVEMNELASGKPKTIALKFENVRRGSNVVLTRMYAQHGNSQGAYQAMGKPKYPTQSQVKELNRAAEVGEPQHTKIGPDGLLNVEIPVNGLVIVEMGK
jgi:xylan 1,4-beta-xylosidase